MRELPDHVWYLVASYITIDDLQGLLDVNRVFLNVALDKRYGEVEWTNPKRMVRSLVRLNDPYVASRTQHLFVRRSVMENLLWNKSDFEDTMPSKVVGKLYDLFATIQGSSTDPLSEIPLEGLENRPRDIVRLMADAIRKMVNLRIFMIEWSNFSLNRDTQRLLESTRSALNPNLYRLVLHIRIPDFVTMFSGTKLDGLHELELQFDHDHSTTSHALINIAPCLNGIFPSLHSLKITSAARLDHSQFFRALGHFPRLELLSARLPFDQIHLSDPFGLNKMLANHSQTLLHLEVLPESWHDSNNALASSTWRTFLEQCLLDLAQWPAGLQSLTIPSTDLPTTMSLIRRVAGTLTTLRLVHRYLTYLEVVDVIDLFSHRSSELKHLTLDITLITPNLISLLARKLPGLISLTLVIQDATNTMHALLRTDPGGSDRIEWNLYDLAIFNGKYRDDSNFITSPTSFEFEEGLMYQMSFLLPSLRSFKGRGHTNMIRIS